MNDKTILVAGGLTYMGSHTVDELYGGRFYYYHQAGDAATAYAEITTAKYS